MQNRRPGSRKRRADAQLARGQRLGRGGNDGSLSSKSLNDITTSIQDSRSGASRTRSLRRQSACFVDAGVANPEPCLLSPSRRRAKRPVDFEDVFRWPLNEAELNYSEEPSHRLGKKSCSTTTVIPERPRYPPLRSQMSDPSDGSGSTPRDRKRESSGKSLMDFTGNEQQSVSYSSCRFKGNFDPLSCSWPTLNANGFSPSSNIHLTGNTLEDSWKSTYAAMVTSQAIGFVPTNVRNPNKAVLTLEYPSTNILIGNDAAHRLFAVGHDQLVGHRLTEMIANASAFFKTGDGPMAEDGDAIYAPSAMEQSDELEEQLTAACGKVIEIVDALDVVSPAAIWLYPLAQAQFGHYDRTFDRCLAVLEPVERICASCTLGPKGRIFACDDYVADVFGYRCSTEILGVNIVELVPALVLPTSKYCTDQFRQNLTGRFRNGASFPVTVKLLPDFDGDVVVKYDVTFYVYTTISGLITVLPSGIVHSFNNHFVSTMFGLRPETLNGKPITTIIPKFNAETAATSTTRCSSVAEDNLLGSPVFLRCSELSLSDRGCLSNGFELGSSNSLLMMCSSHSPSSTSATINGSDPGASAGKEPSASAPARNGPTFVSTPCRDSVLTARNTKEGDVNDDSLLEDDMHGIPEGSFWGFGLHRDGSLFGIGYQIRRLVLKDGSVLYCVWVVRDPEALICHNLSRFGTFDSSGTERSDSSLDSVPELLDTAKKALSLNKTQLDLESEGKEYIRGEYAQYYDTLQQIGKGAYGCVKMAARKSDGLLVVAKFIRKEQILADCWTDDNRLGRVPMEIYLLFNLKHENIVQVVDVYQNDTYFQLVMEKHGSGMDLFEFIDRRPVMNEKLISCIFRQVVAAVSYLHSMNIVHRDIKDENVIIDERFCCKLIDFGSAAYFKDGKTFSTICGTIEYCSPEVLAGNRYHGPELDMWSLGILLYTLIFFENPFDSVEDTIRAYLEPPWDISEGLYHLLAWLLHPNPHNRATISDVERHWWVTQQIDVKQFRFEDVMSVNDFRELNPPKYLPDLKTAVSAQISPVVSQIAKMDKNIH